MRIDGYDKPLDLAATMTFGETGIDVTSPARPAPPRYGIKRAVLLPEAYSSFGVKCIVAPKVPNNEGSLSVIRINGAGRLHSQCKWPAPVATRHVTGQLLPDVMFGCLHPGAAQRRAGRRRLLACGYLFASRPGSHRRRPGGHRACDRVQTDELHAGARVRVGQGRLSATAFPKRVATCQSRSTRRSRRSWWEEGVSPGLGRRGRVPRQGLGQVMESATDRHRAMALSAYYDRIQFPPACREAPDACG